MTFASVVSAKVVQDEVNTKDPIATQIAKVVKTAVQGRFKSEKVILAFQAMNPTAIKHQELILITGRVEVLGKARNG